MYFLNKGIYPFLFDNNKKKEAIIMKDITIQSLIKKENEIIKSYKSYLTNIPVQEIDNKAQDSIVRHNNHVETLKNIIGR